MIGLGEDLLEHQGFGGCVRGRMARGCGAGRDLLWRRQEAPGGTTGTCKSGLETVGRRTRRAAPPPADTAACRPLANRDTIASVASPARPRPPPSLHTLPNIYVNNTRAIASARFQTDRSDTLRSIVNIRLLLRDDFRFTERSAMLHYYIVHM